MSRAGLVGFCVPQRDEAAAEVGLGHQVVAGEAQLDVGDAHRLHAAGVDHVAAELAVEHDDDRSHAVGSRRPGR